MRNIFHFTYCLLLIILFLAAFLHPITAINVDLGRHILFGKIIATTHRIPNINLLSYTYPNFPYINTSWLTDVMYYFLFALGGFALLLLSNTILIALAFGLLVFYFTKKYRLTTATLLSVTLYLLLLSSRPDIRPEVMSMVCLSLFMVILFSYRKSGGWKMYLLVPIEILWVNLHIYFFVGPFLIVLFFLDDLLISRFTFAKAKIYFFCLAGTIAATLINPNGIQGALFPLTVLNNYGFPVAENQSLWTLFAVYHSAEMLLPVATIIVLFVILFLAKKNTRPVDWLLASIFSLAAILIFRNILLFVFTTFPIFTEQVNFLSKKYRLVIAKIPTLSYVFLYPLPLMILVVFITASITSNGVGFGVTPYGEKAVNFIRDQHMHGPIYNNFDIGDYLSYRIYPQKIFVDNRPEAYPASFFENLYLPMQYNPNIFKKLDKKYQFNILVIEYWDGTPWGTPFLQYVVNHSQFRLVYLDQYMIVLLRSIPANKTILSKYGIDPKKVTISSRQTSQELIHDLFFFEKAGWRDQEVSLLTKMKKEDPSLCMVRKYPIEKTFINEYITKNHLVTSCSIFL